MRWQRWLRDMYSKRVLAPQFDALGVQPFFYKPRSTHISGKNIRAGKHLHIISEAYKPVNLSTWSSKQHQGEITIGDHCLISPGANIASAQSISIGNDCMIAAEVNISDCDWHGVYNRTRPFRCTSSIVLKNNVWVGFRAIIGKGITIGENSIVAAGSVVTQDVPDNCIVGGNPAVVIKEINPKRKMLTREFLFRHSDDAFYLRNQELLMEYVMGGNSIFNWIRTLVKPNHLD